MKKQLTYIFLSAIGVMMVIYLACDVLSIWDSRPLKFAASTLITFCGLSALNKSEGRFVSIGLMFTLLADVFLVLLNKYLYGVGVFVVAQLCYAVYLTKLSDKTVYKELLKRVVPAAAITVILAFAGFKGNIVFPAAYAVCIGINIAHSVELNLKKPCKKHMLLVVGFIVFVVGDICVGLRHMPFVTEAVASVLYFITWLTYPPGQILILSSTGVLNFNKTKPSEN